MHNVQSAAGSAGQPCDVVGLREVVGDCETDKYKTELLPVLTMDIDVG